VPTVARTTRILLPRAGRRVCVFSRHVWVYVALGLTANTHHALSSAQLVGPERAKMCTACRQSGTGSRASVKRVARRWCRRAQAPVPAQTAESREWGGAQIAPNTTTSQGNPHSIPHGVEQTVECVQAHDPLYHRSSSPVSCRCISHAHAHGSTDSAKAKAHLRHLMCASPCQRQHPAPPDRARYMQSAWARRDPRR